MTHDPFDVLRVFTTASGQHGRYCSLAALESAGLGAVSRLPVSLRLVLESVLRHCDGENITEAHVRALAGWQPQAPRSEEIPFVVARVVLQDFTGVPLLCDLAAMRDAAAAAGGEPGIVEPLVAVDLVVDHSVMIDHWGRPDALELNLQREYERNRERYAFLKWGTQALRSFRVVPPGTGIVHQVNLEYLCRGVHERDGITYPDTLVGTDSHTTMIDALGVLGWGVGGIEAEAAMLGQPLYFLTPDVVGVELTGRLREGVTATDLVLAVTERLRRERVVGCFVEFCGEGTAGLSVTDRATIANMAPEYGATTGFFPVDARTLEYLQHTGRSDEEIERFEAYFRAQGLFGVPAAAELDFSRLVTIDLATVVPSLAGPKRPQDRIALDELPARFRQLLAGRPDEGGYGLTAEQIDARVPLAGGGEPAENREDALPADLGHGDVLIAAITSCTNTSNPEVMVAAGLLARAAVGRGLTVRAGIKTSLAPGSRVVSDYLERAGLLAPLAELGFALSAYGCTTCIGNAGELAPAIEQAVAGHGLVCAAVLSGNRNFEARIHPRIRANFLGSPPLVVAYALAGRIDIDLAHEPLGHDADGRPVFLRELWPTRAEIADTLAHASDPDSYRRRYGAIDGGPLWQDIPVPNGARYHWPDSAYIARPPFFDGFTRTPSPPADIRDARALLILGDSVTTDHISPAGSFRADSPAGRYLQSLGVPPAEFNSYGSRRGNHEVMIRGTFANVRIRNRMLAPGADGKPVEGGWTLLDGERVTVYDAAMEYGRRGVPTLVFAGEEYGTGSSRDWAAKGTLLLGVRAVVARSYERIHRSNLVGMGVLPLQFSGEDSAHTLNLGPDDRFDLPPLASLKPQQTLELTIRSPDGSVRQVPVLCRIDTPIELTCFRHGGILPWVLRQLLDD